MLNKSVRGLLYQYGFAKSFSVFFISMNSKFTFTKNQFTNEYILQILAL